MFNHYAADLILGSAALAALIYIGRQVGKVAILAKLLARLPGEHEQLLQATAANTASIAALTAQLAALTSDVAILVRR